MRKTQTQTQTETEAIFYHGLVGNAFAFTSNVKNGLFLPQVMVFALDFSKMQKSTNYADTGFTCEWMLTKVGE